MMRNVCKQEKRRIKLAWSSKSGPITVACQENRFCSNSMPLRRNTLKKCKREKLWKEMLEMEEDDHLDLLKMMEKVKKKDVPADMVLFWEEQQKILETASCKRYRWHPR